MPSSVSVPSWRRSSRPSSWGSSAPWMSAELGSSPTPGPIPIRRRTAWGRELAAFCTVALLVLLVLLAVSAGTVWLSERIARDNALEEADGVAERLAELLVAPVLADALAGVPGRWEELDRNVRNRMSDGSVTRMVVWRATGEIVYSSETGQRGRVIAPSDGLLAAIGGDTPSQVAEAPPTTPGDGPRPLLEGHTPLTLAGGQLAFAAYFSYARL